jgi:hypothetical protein
LRASESESGGAPGSRAGGPVLGIGDDGARSERGATGVPGSLRSAAAAPQATSRDVGPPADFEKSAGVSVLPKVGIRSAGSTVTHGDRRAAGPLGRWAAGPPAGDSRFGGQAAAAPPGDEGRGRAAGDMRGPFFFLLS